MYLRVVLVLCLLVSMKVNAGHIDCDYVDIGVLYVQSERSDSSSHHNKLILGLGGECPTYGYVSNTDPAYASIFSMLLAAKMSKEQIRVVVSDEPLLSSAARIVMVNFK